jgi:hypothetical protein
MYMKKTLKNTLYIFFATIAMVIQAKENVNHPGGNATTPDQSLAFNCAAGTAQTLLDINNVKTMILNGGDMWWDLSNPKYEIPKNSGKHSLFAGSLWIGGLDDEDQLKVAAQTYRQSGNDFWPGPLDNARLTSDENLNNKYGTTNADVCSEYDYHHVITRAEVEAFLAFSNSNEPNIEFPNYSIPSSILNYPGDRKLEFQSENSYEGYDDVVATNPYYALETLAPYRDVNNDGKYTPSAGDYPEYNIDGTFNCQEADMLFGDQTLWWVYNDKGESHTASGSLEPIGLEIQAQAFAFSTNDEINNMTFYNYKLINRSHNALNDAYFGVHVDPDLGNYQDDFVGCDVARGLGYCYNGDENDETAEGYGVNPPAIGVDFFRGPIADEGDGIDNDLDGIIDEIGEQIIMSKFMYFNNDQSVTGNPDIAQDFYNYLQGKWLDNKPMTYGADGRDDSSPLCSYMFPGDTDPLFPDSWTEQIAGNTPADRRFVQSAGPFTLEPGALNTITTGVVWARASSGGAWQSVELMRIADDKAQKLFDICFEVLDGPDAPDLTLQELDKEIVFTITNAANISNNNQNSNEDYVEQDLINISGFYDDAGTLPYNDSYVFEGYQVFQLLNETVTASDVYDIDKARLVFQCDVENYRDANGAVTSEPTDLPIADLVNFEFSSELDAVVPKDMTLQAANEGITHSFVINQDLFAPGDRTLINNKTYYFTAIAYGYNEYLQYAQDVTPDASNIYAPSFNGQKKPFLAGRKNIRQYSAIPHLTFAESNGTIQNADYGTTPQMTRLEGLGNGGLELQFTTEMKAKLMNGECVVSTDYETDGGPVNIKVIDPLNVPENTEFTFTLNSVNDTASWILTNVTSGVSVSSDTIMRVKNEQIIAEWGLSVTLVNGLNAGEDREGTNGLISANIIKDNSTSWLDFVDDQDFFFNRDGVVLTSPANWIRSGADQSADPSGGDEAVAIDIGGLDDWEDPKEAFEGVLNGMWAPYRLVAFDRTDVPFGHAASFKYGEPLEELNSVDIVYTSDKNLWTRVPVIETGDFDYRGQLKTAPSVGKDGIDEVGGTTGFSWFPGYALDLEKGIRLNMMFGEASDLPDDNGTDMIWNPTSTDYSGENFFDPENKVIFGGRHYVYVCTSEYAGENEEDHPQYTRLTSMSSIVNQRRVYQEVSWVSIPLTSQNATVSDGDIEMQLRVSKAYAKYNHEVNPDCEELPSDVNDGNPYYSFSTESIMTVRNAESVAKSAMDLIRVVPNPYYGGNNYENGQIDAHVKFTNLPKVCTISIYNVSGSLVRKVDLDSELNVSGWDWDLKNNSNIAIASGVYIIHVDGKELGEKVLKWFGALRPIDLDSF